MEPIRQRIIRDEPTSLLIKVALGQPGNHLTSVSPRVIKTWHRIAEAPTPKTPPNAAQIVPSVGNCSSRMMLHKRIESKPADILALFVRSLQDNAHHRVGRFNS